MYIKIKKNPTKKILVTLLILIALAVLGYFLYTRFISSKDNTSTINLAPPTSQQQQAGVQTKQNALDTSSTNPKTSGSDQPPQPTPIPNSSKSNVQVEITAANQNGATFQVRTLISAVVNDGTCTLTLQKAGYNTVTMTATTQALASTSTCKGFDIPTSQLAAGTWHLTVSYDNPTLTGKAQKDIIIN